MISNKFPSLNLFSMRYAMCLVAGFLSLYASLVPGFNTPLYNFLLFLVPDKQEHDITKDLERFERNYRTKAERIEFASVNGRKIRGLFLEQPGSRRVFLVSHGRGNNIYTRLFVADLFLRSGGSVFLYDYQGYGLSEGEASVETACQDGVAAYDYVVGAKGRSGDDVIAYGESFGAAVTGYMVERRPMAGVILHSAFSSLLAASRENLFWLRFYPDSSFPPNLPDNVAVFKKKHPPMLIVHGTGDNRLSWSNSRRLYDAAAEPKQLLLLEGSGHVSFDRDEELFDTVKQFLVTHKI